MNNDEGKRPPRHPASIVGLFVLRLLVVGAGICIFVKAVPIIVDLIRSVIQEHEAQAWAKMSLAGLAGASLLIIVQSGAEVAARFVCFVKSWNKRSWTDFGRRFVDFARHVTAPVVCVTLALGLGNDVLPVSRADVTRITFEMTRKAMERQGYTAPRARKLDLIHPGFPDADAYFARFAIAFHRGELVKGDVTGAIRLDEVEFSRGLEFATNGEELVYGLVEALAPCGNVRLRVEGYASSQPFSGVDRKDSDALNVRLANLRADRVARMIREALSAHGEASQSFGELDVAQFDDLEQMRSYLQFNDRPEGIEVGEDETPSQDLLTRAAHIKVMDAGLCAVESD